MNLQDAFCLSDHTQNIEYLYTKVLEKAKELPENIPFLEVGTRAGGTALAFLFAIRESNKRKRPFFTVDPYGNKPYLRGIEVLDMNYGEHFQRTAMYYLSKFALDNKLSHQHWRLTSHDFMIVRDLIAVWYEGKLLENNYGFVYLDGDHEEKIIEEEINYFSPRLCEKGLLVIDDSEHIVDSSSTIIQSLLKNSTLYGNRIYWEKQ